MTHKPRKHRLKVAALTIIALGLLPAAPSYAGFYKWVDENGKVQFSDTPPPPSNKNGYDVLGDSGTRVRTVERELTEEELQAVAKHSEEKKQQALIDQEEERVDRLIMLSFPNQKALDAAREDRLSTLDDTIAYLRSRKDTLIGKRDENTARIQSFNRKKLDIPYQLTSESETIESAIEHLNAQIADIQKDRKASVIEFQGYSERLLSLSEQ